MAVVQTVTQLSPDTQAALLLCGHFGRGDTTSPAPLKPSEYNQVAKWLLQQDMRPADLLRSDTQQALQQPESINFDVQRILHLLIRGGLLALQVESWTSQGLWVISRSDDRVSRETAKAPEAFCRPRSIYGAGNSELLNELWRSRYGWIPQSG